MVARDLPRTLLRFCLDLFAPVAEIGQRFGKEAVLLVRGSGLSPATEVGRVVRVGTVFQPFRVVPVKDGPELVREIPFTYLRVDSTEGAATRSTFLSMFSDPFTGRVVQKTRLIALGTRPGGRPTRLRFLTLPDRAPAAGYALSARSVPDGLPRAIGLTDRDGGITLPARAWEGLEVFRLAAGGDEPMREFPLMPGSNADELVIPPFDPKPRAVALATRIESVRDPVIDQVAVRARIEARLKARFDGEDYNGAATALNEAGTLPGKEAMVREIANLRDEAARRQAEEKTPVLTRNAQARLAELQGLVERYLDDEVFKGYSDALAKQKSADASKQAKSAQAKSNTNTAPIPPQQQSQAQAQAQAQAQVSSPAQAKPQAPPPPVGRGPQAHRPPGGPQDRGSFLKRLARSWDARPGGWWQSGSDPPADDQGGRDWGVASSAASHPGWNRELASGGSGVGRRCGRTCVTTDRSTC
jgi:hypothetical protein